MVRALRASWSATGFVERLAELRCTARPFCDSATGRTRYPQLPRMARAWPRRQCLRRDRPAATRAARRRGSARGATSRRARTTSTATQHRASGWRSCVERLGDSSGRDGRARRGEVSARRHRSCRPALEAQREMRRAYQRAEKAEVHGEVSGRRADAVSGAGRRRGPCRDLGRPGVTSRDDICGADDPVRAAESRWTTPISARGSNEQPGTAHATWKSWVRGSATLFGLRGFRAVGQDLAPLRSSVGSAATQLVQVGWQLACSSPFARDRKHRARRPMAHSA